jgi:hypothetical protein
MKSKNIIPLFCSLALLASTGLFADDTSASGPMPPVSDITISASVVVSLYPQNIADEVRCVSVSSLADLDIIVDPINNYGSSSSIYRVDKTKLVYDKTKFSLTSEDIVKSKQPNNIYSSYMKTLYVLPLAEGSTTETTDITITVPYSDSISFANPDAQAIIGDRPITAKSYKTITLHVTINP